MVVKDEITGEAKIKCDKCDTVSPPAAEVLAGHGLNNMGWRCSGGNHRCPSCKETKVD